MKSHLTRSLRKIFSFATTTIAKKYIQKDRWYTYDVLRLKVYKDVFHPGLFRSTKVFAEWIATQNIQHKKILEIGSGSGMISLVAAKHGGNVTAVDINPKAVENTKLNASINQLSVDVFYSDLFANVPATEFDMVLINPPYYPKQAKNDYEKAWYCGEGFEYFTKLFNQLNERRLQRNCYIILSDTCDMNAIEAIAKKEGIGFQEMFSKNVSGEKLMIIQTIKSSYTSGV